MWRKSGEVASLLWQQRRSNKQRVHMAFSLGKAGCDLFEACRGWTSAALNLHGSDLHTSHHRLCSYSKRRRVKSQKGTGAFVSPISFNAGNKHSHIYSSLIPSRVYMYYTCPRLSVCLGFKHSDQVQKVLLVQAELFHQCVQIHHRRRRLQGSSHHRRNFGQPETQNHTIITHCLTRIHFHRHKYRFSAIFIKKKKKKHLESTGKEYFSIHPF